MNEQKLKILTREEAIDLLDNQIEYTFQLEKQNKNLHNKIEKAIEYMKLRFMNCIDNEKRYFEDYYIQEIYEILKDSNVNE